MSRQRRGLAEDTGEYLGGMPLALTESSDPGSVSSPKKGQFILGGLPAPEEYESEDRFRDFIISLFYRILVIHNEHLYAETSDIVLAKLFRENIEQLDDENRYRIEALFLDPRFIEIIARQTVRCHSGAEYLQPFIDPLLKDLSNTENETSRIHELLTHSYFQVWASLVGSENSILSILIEHRTRTDAATESLDPSALRLAERLTQLRGQIDERVADLQRTTEKIRALRKTAHQAARALARADEKTAALHEAVQQADAALEAEEARGSDSDMFSQTKNPVDDIIVRFLRLRINDIYLMTTEICFYITTQNKEITRKLGSTFTMKELIYNALFFDEAGAGFLRNVTTDSPQQWLERFFLTFYVTICRLTSHQSREITYKSLDDSFRANRAAFQNAITSLAGEEIKVLDHVKLTLLSIMNARGYYIDFQNASLVAGALASIFLEPFTEIAEARETCALEKKEAARLMAEKTIDRKAMQTRTREAETSLSESETRIRVRFLAQLEPKLPAQFAWTIGQVAVPARTHLDVLSQLVDTRGVRSEPPTPVKEKPETDKGARTGKAVSDAGSKAAKPPSKRKLFTGTPPGSTSKSKRSASPASNGWCLFSCFPCVKRRQERQRAAEAEISRGGTATGPAKPSLAGASDSYVFELAVDDRLDPSRSSGVSVITRSGPISVPPRSTKDSDSTSDVLGIIPSF